MIGRAAGIALLGWLCLSDLAVGQAPARGPASRPALSLTQICFVKYGDVNGNGIRNAGESLLPNWQFTLYDSANVVAGGGITGPSASQPGCFIVSPGTYTLKETPKSGWYQTQPFNLAPHTVTVAAGQTVNIAFGNRQGSPTRICAVKYNDLNGNHGRDVGEPALAGFTFRLYQGSTLIGIAVSNASGSACFTVPPGTYRLVENPLAGWTVTDPASGPPQRIVTAVLGTTVTTRFGNRQVPRRICPQKYADLDGDGTRDSGEPLIAGFTFQLYSGTTLIATGTSDPNGAFCFMVPPGTYRVVEVQQPGWANTDPGTATLDKVVTMTATTGPARPAFGNRLLATALDLRIDTAFSKAISPQPPGYVFLIVLSQPNSAPIPAGAVLTVQGSLSPGSPTFLAMTPSAGWSCTGPWTGFVCTTALAAAAAYPTLQLHAAASASAPGTTVTYAASVAMAGNTDPDPSNDSRTVTHSIN